MRIRVADVEVEGKNEKEIEKLLQRALKFQKEIKPATQRNQPISINKKERKKRKEKLIPFPKGKFTVHALAEKTGISTATIYQRLLKMQVAGNAKIVGEKRTESRGKPTKYWQVAEGNGTLDFDVAETKHKKGKRFDIDLDNVMA